MKKKVKTTKIMLAISVFNVLWFTIAAIILQFKMGIELSSTLIVSWYTFWTVEIWTMSGITKKKVEFGQDSEVEDDGMVG